ncbi:MAG: DUF5694 domain-containing protein [Sphingomicrobium sp.]
MKIIWAATVVALQLSSPAAAQNLPRDPAEKACPADAVDLLILGSYHMDNPGLDSVNIEADDVLTPRRQAEIAALNAALLQFRPTKVAVEGDRSKSTWQDRYSQWLEGSSSLGRNEIEQIGMKVARAAGHTAIYPIDFPMLMSGLRYDEVEIRKPEPSGAKPPPPRQLSEDELLLRRQTVTETLRRMNHPDAIAAAHLPYMDLLEPDPEDPALYGKSDYLVNWYKRNIRMMANVARISVPGDRVLLIVGAGHLSILRDFAIHSPAFCLADTLHYLDKSTPR